MATGLLALLDDIAAIAKVAAASLDDTAAAAAKAGAKAAGVVVDDAAVTPRYVTGFAAARELPIVAKIALGSLKNKLLFLLPAALALSALAPWAITPLLMAGGAYLCFEGAEKVHEALFPHAPHDVPGNAAAETDPARVESTMVKGAIRTDFILSGEIMAITLAAVAANSFWQRAVVLAVVGVGITVAVYGAVALIVKADDAGAWLARREGRWAAPLRGLGRGMVKGMPPSLRLLGIIGTAAMLWVGGGIIVHGLEGYGLDWLGHGIASISSGAAALMPFAGGFTGWLTGAALAGLVGLAIGAAIVAVLQLLPKKRVAAAAT